MAEHPNAALVRKIDEAWSSGDPAALDTYIADDIVWHEIGRSKPRRGKAALRKASAGDTKITGKLHDAVANDTHAIALVDATATRGKKTLKYRTAEIYHIKDGKVVERWAFSDDTAAITKFFK